MVSREAVVTDPEQFNKHRLAAIGKPLKDGEERIFIVPAFDYRKSETHHQYGQHYAEMSFAKRRGDFIASVDFYTGWEANPTDYFRKGGTFMCTGIYYHYPKKTEYSNHQKDCLLRGGECFGEIGSALYGEEIAEKIVLEGSASIFKELDLALDYMAKRSDDTDYEKLADRIGW